MSLFNGFWKDGDGFGFGEDGDGSTSLALEMASPPVMPLVMEMEVGLGSSKVSRVVQAWGILTWELGFYKIQPFFTQIIASPKGHLDAEKTGGELVPRPNKSKKVERKSPKKENPLTPSPL